MSEMVGKVLLQTTLFCSLMVFCCQVCAGMRNWRRIQELCKSSIEKMDSISSKRLLDNRRNLLSLQQKESLGYVLWHHLDQELNYSGWKRKIPFLTVEFWLAGNIGGLGILFGAGSVLLGPLRAVIVCGLLGMLEVLFLYFCKWRAFRSVNGNLMKFLDFLGNYSITSGEITSVLQQISKYVEDPLRSVLDECSYEAQTTGDVRLALLSMAEKIEHPQFKELTRNMEISVRYCSDFTLLVNSSRRMLREYLRLGEEQKGMLREGVINMALLMGLSFVTLGIVDGLVETSVWTLMLYSGPGRMACGVILFILFRFTKKLVGRR